ncbi:VWA domain-containing protein, partial [Singulisphaera rosea]
MLDWLLIHIADRLGVEPARAGEAIVPRIRFEQPWPQAVTLLVVLGSVGLVVWLYRREGSAPRWYRMGLAALRISLILLAVFMLSEAVLSVERTGLPYFVVMLDDSASGQVVDQYADPKTKKSLSELTKSPEPNRFGVARSLLEQDKARLLRELQKQNKVRLYLVSSTSRMLAELDKPEDLEPALEALAKVAPTGGQSRLG